MSKTIKELKELVKTDILIGEKMSEGLENSQNPQVRDMYIREIARLEALKDVLSYCENGEKHWFRRIRDYEEFL